MPRIELGLVDNVSFFADEHVDEIEQAINESSNAGDIKMTIAAVAQPGWLLLLGQVVVAAQADYPDLWGVAPADWKVGADLHLPNATQRFPIGAGTVPLGSVGGLNTHELAAANLPPHGHDMGHDHPPGTVTGATTTQDSDVIDYLGGGHQHGPNGDATAFVTDGGGGNPSADIQLTGSGGSYILNPLTEDGGLHHHDIAGTVDLAPFAGNTGNGAGVSTPVDHTPAWFAVYFAVRAY